MVWESTTKPNAQLNHHGPHSGNNTHHECHNHVGLYNADGHNWRGCRFAVSYVLRIHVPRSKWIFKPSSSKQTQLLIHCVYYYFICLTIRQANWYMMYVSGSPMISHDAIRHFPTNRGWILKFDTKAMGCLSAHLVFSIWGVSILSPQKLRWRSWH